MTHKQMLLCKVIKEKNTYNKMDLLVDAIEQRIVRDNKELQEMLFSLYKLGAVVGVKGNDNNISMVKGFVLEEQPTETKGGAYPSEYSDRVRKIVEELIETLSIKQRGKKGKKLTTEEYENLCMYVIKNTIAIDPKITREMAIAIANEMLKIAKDIRTKIDCHAKGCNDKTLSEIFQRVANEFEIATDEQCEMLRKRLYKN